MSYIATHASTNSLLPKRPPPQTLLTHARLVRRWFGQHAAELPPHTSGDPYLMLGELLARRAREPEGGDNALLEAGACVGCVVCAACVCGAASLRQSVSWLGAAQPARASAPADSKD